MNILCVGADLSVAHGNICYVKHEVDMTILSYNKRLSDCYNEQMDSLVNSL